MIFFWHRVVSEVPYALANVVAMFLFNIIGILVHEWGHLSWSGGQMRAMQIGMKPKRSAGWMRFAFGRVEFYPLFPLSGWVKIRKIPKTRLRWVMTSLGGPLTGTLFGIIIFLAGWAMIPESTFAWYRDYGHTVKSFARNIMFHQGAWGKTSYLLMAHGFGQIVGHMSNLLPVRPLDGWAIRRTLNMNAERFSNSIGSRPGY